MKCAIKNRAVRLGMMDMSDSIPDEERFSQWVSQYGSLIQAYIRNQVGEDSTAEDLTQETFCRAWSARKNYIEQGTPKKYLFSIAERILIDFHRKMKPSLFKTGEELVEFESIDHNISPAEQAILSEHTQLLQSAMAKLSEIQRKTLLLRYYGQFSFAEIADIIHVPLGTALSHCHRALEQLRLSFGESNENKK